MTRIRTIKTNFTAGEVSPELLGRGDLRAYENGAARLRNVFVLPTGGVTRRAGLAHVAAIAMAPGQGGGRLAAFEFNTEQAYLLLFRHLRVDIFRDDTLVRSLSAPWTRDQLPELAWTQTADTLLACHPEVPPKLVIRGLDGEGAETWRIEDWRFVSEKIYGREENGEIDFYGTDKERDGERFNLEGTALRQPYYKFAAADVTLTPGGRSGPIALTASAPVFLPGHVGTHLRVEEREVRITAVASATEATGIVQFRLNGTDAVADWDEPAFSAVRGWPATCTFHQDRLVVGGSRDLPNRLWLSKSADLFNFDLGEGLDDEAVEFAILSDQVNAIRAVFSGRHLQVFTSGAEWMVVGDPVTPESFALRRQTRIGSLGGRRVPPRDIDGATLFAGRSGRDLREFLFADVEQAYQANDLAILARHLVRDPIDMDYDGARRLLHVVTADGALATVTIYRSEEVTAWTRQEIAGRFHAVAVVGSAVYVLTERDGRWAIERFDDAFRTDAAIAAAADPAQAEWHGLAHLEGLAVTVVADGDVLTDCPVAEGAVVLPAPASSVEIGLPFFHEIAPLPPAAIGGGGGAQGRTLRAIDVVFRVLETQALRVDTGDGFRDVVFRRFGVADDGGPVTGDRRVFARGWHRESLRPPWRIRQDAPRPATLLSAALHLKVND